MNSKLMSKIRKLHRWLALIVGIQLFIWTASGLYMTAMPLYMVHGKHLITPVESTIINTNETIFPIASILQQHNEVTSVEFKKIANQSVYVVKSSEGTRIYDAKTGQPNLLVTADKAKEIAGARYTGIAKVSSVVKIESSSQAPEIGGRATPIWQVNFDDWVNTSIYVSTNMEQVSTVRSDIWRIFDFFQLNRRHFIMPLQNTGNRKDSVIGIDNCRFNRRYKVFSMHHI